MEEINEQEEFIDLTSQEHYVPRPAWQRAAAWVGLAIVIAGVILYYIQIATGGM